MTIKAEGSYQQVRLNDGTVGNYSVARTYYMELLRLSNDRVGVFNALCRYVRDPHAVTNAKVATVLKRYNPQMVSDLTEVVRLCARDRIVSPVHAKSEERFNHFFHRDVKPQYDLVSIFRDRIKSNQLANVKPLKRENVAFTAVTKDEFKLPSFQLRPVLEQAERGSGSTEMQFNDDHKLLDTLTPTPMPTPVPQPYRDTGSLLWTGDDISSAPAFKR